MSARERVRQKGEGREKESERRGREGAEGLCLQSHPPRTSTVTVTATPPSLSPPSSGHHAAASGDVMAGY